ncbi:MAG: response regulator transcription factor [Sneathiella sp.]|nr:response regulator transcription factor [Sneathiella sp.]
MRVLIVDKFEICRSGLRFVLEENFPDSTICEAKNADEALDCLDDHGADLVIFSVNSYLSPDHEGIGKLRPYAQNLPVIVVGDPEDWPSIKELTSYNVRGFLDRSSNKDVMIAAVQLILAGGQYFPPELHEGVRSIRTDSNQKLSVDIADNSTKLTRRQLEVLSAVAEGKSNKAIAAELGISPGTVKVHISNWMKDLNANNRTQAVSIANNLNILRQAM